jgi:hypothetical protein
VAFIVSSSILARPRMVDEVRPLEKRVMERPANSWTDVAELAEISWWGTAHRGDRYGDYPASVLAKAVLSLGGGERFYLHDDGKSDRRKADLML